MGPPTISAEQHIIVAGFVDGICASMGPPTISAEQRLLLIDDPIKNAEASMGPPTISAEQHGLRHLLRLESSRFNGAADDLGGATLLS
ncbi:hypothetical protein TC41_0034 [Alicyclobacillus acidocaldarius subsp. acidocaldarius Tc-4-1]|uniref:Uncharacterized protein n=1 Tax=Alicyclobacillus acidocaldarius (strain Tc-4-1) TaxID=1048834 RepID=F8IHP7_ALIAT|nr:hypothetical protein TC41_0034 [Alicyclobacillus acidocaldarius subsp. acidocaldarius Tc-4-1]